VIEEVIAATGKITKVAGNGRAGYSGDGGPATAAELNGARGVAVDSSGNLFIADTYNNVIREVSASTGIITTVAGNGTSGYKADGEKATSAELNGPYGVAVDSSGDLFIADTGNNVIREVSAATGKITTIAGNNTPGYSGDHGAATQAELDFPARVVLDGQGNLFVSDCYNNAIREIKAATGKITTVAGDGFYGYSGDGGAATSAELAEPVGIALDSHGNLFIADFDNNVIREVKASTGIISTVAGNGSFGYTGDGGKATSTELAHPEDVAVDPFGVLYIADPYNERIRVVGVGGLITTFAGDGLVGYTGDGGPATSAKLISPFADAVDSKGDVFIVDFYNNVVREVTPAGKISTVAGNGTQGYSGDGGKATAAALNEPLGVTVDPAGNLYIADSGNNVVRKVTAASGVITTIAGDSLPGYSGDNGNPTAAELSSPEGVALDPWGDLYIADTNNDAIRLVSVFTGDIYTYLNLPSGGFPRGIAVDSAFNLYIAEPDINQIEELNGGTGKTRTIAGNGSSGYSGDGGKASSAELAYPTGVAVDSSGNLFIADSGNDVIREVSAASGKISTVAGNAASGYSGNGGPARDAELNNPQGVATDTVGDLFIADTGNNVIRELTPFTVVASAQIEQLKTGKKKSQDVIVITFSAALNPDDAQILGTYSLETVPKGKKGKSQTVALAHASYDLSKFTVTLTTRKPLKLPPAVQLTVKALRLFDRLGDPLDAGRDFRTIFRKG
jgi:sugar lactone lactonase YvrE